MSISPHKIDQNTMAVISRYFKTTDDFVNVIKTNSEYRQLGDVIKQNNVAIKTDRDRILFRKIETYIVYDDIDIYKINRLNTRDYFKKKYDVEIDKFRSLKIKYPVTRKQKKEYEEDMETIKGVRNIEFMEYIDEYNYNGELDPKVTYLVRSSRFGIFQDHVPIKELDLSNIHVKVINDRCFQYHIFTSVKLPDTIKILGEEAFGACNELKEINLPTSICRIDNGCFCFCGLEKIIFPSALTEISEECCYGCKCLKHVVIPDRVKVIKSRAFHNCENLVTIEFGKNIERIDGESFVNCKVDQLLLPTKLQEIEWYAFCNCVYLTSLTIPDSVTHLGYNCFNRCSSLVSVSLGNGIEYLGGDTFANCKALRLVETGAKFRDYSPDAFRGSENVQISKKRTDLE